MNKNTIFISRYENAEFGYRQAITGAFRELQQRNRTGRTLGQIGTRFGSKLVNATKGKIASLGKLAGRVGKTFTGGNKVRNIKLNDGQLSRATRNISNSGGRKKIVSGEFIPTTSTYNNKPLENKIKIDSFKKK